MKSFKSILFCQTLLPLGLQLLTLHIHPSPIPPSSGTPDAEAALFYQVSHPALAHGVRRSPRAPWGANMLCTTSAHEKLRLQSTHGSKGQPECGERVHECLGASSSSQLHPHPGKCFEGSGTLCTHTVLCFALASYHPAGTPDSEVLGTGHTNSSRLFFLTKLSETAAPKPQGLSPSRTFLSHPPPKKSSSSPGTTVSSTFPKLHFPSMSKSRQKIGFSFQAFLGLLVTRGLSQVSQRQRLRGKSCVW